MPNGAPPEHTDWNTWRGQTDAHFGALKDGQEKIHGCLKKHIEQTEQRLNGVEQETAVHSTKIKTHWWFIAFIIASLLGLGVKAASAPNGFSRGIRLALRFETGATGKSTGSLRFSRAEIPLRPTASTLRSS